MKFEALLTAFFLAIVAMMSGCAADDVAVATPVPCKVWQGKEFCPVGQQLVYEDETETCILAAPERVFCQQKK